MQNIYTSFGGDSMNKLVIMFGLPGSGKDRLIKNHYFDCEVLSSDDLRVELYGFEDQTHNKEVFDEMNRRAKELGRAGKNVVYNATNLNRGRRIALCQEMQKFFSEIEICAAICPIDVLFERNITREERHLPEDKLMQMIASCQIPNAHEYPYSKIYFYRTGKPKEPESMRLTRIYDYDQNNKHHSEVLGVHIQRVAAYCLANPMAYIAALYHDLGKPFVRSTDEEGFSHYFGHANVSAYLFLTDLLSQKEVHNKDFFLDIALMIEFHDYIFSFDMDFERMKERFSARFSGLSDEFWEALRLLTLADRIRPESA